MGYTGKQFRSQEDYILMDTILYNPSINLEKLRTIQNKIESFTSGESSIGINPEETAEFLDWIIFNSRNYAVRNTHESVISSQMNGQCAPTQRINVKLLSKFGLDARDFNTADCIGEIPINEEDKRRIQNGHLSTAVRHSVSLVKLPIQNEYGTTEIKEFLLDPTFRQFCLKENCNLKKFSDAEWLRKGYVAPHPGFFMQKHNLENLGVDIETAQKSEDLCKLIISRGYFELTDENTKLYGDAFVKSSKRLEFQNYPINMSGRDYRNNFENIRMGMLYTNKKDEKFLKKPSDLLEKENNKKTGNKIVEFFKRIFGKKTKRLPKENIQQFNIPDFHNTFVEKLNTTNYDQIKTENSKKDTRS